MINIFTFGSFRLENSGCCSCTLWLFTKVNTRAMQCDHMLKTVKQSHSKLKMCTMCRSEYLSISVSVYLTHWSSIPNHSHTDPHLQLHFTYGWRFELCSSWWPNLPVSISPTGPSVLPDLPPQATDPRRCTHSHRQMSVPERNGRLGLVWSGLSLGNTEVQ